MPNIVTARDEILTRVKAVMDADTDFDNVERFFPDVEQEVPTDGTTSWVRISLNHLPDGEQRTLGSSTTGRSFGREGIILCEIFTPSGDGLTTAYDLSTILLTAFEGYKTSSGVWFRSAGVTEGGQEGKYHQLNVVASFDYEEDK